MRIVIVDDEQASAKEVERLVIKHFPQFTVSGIFNGIREAVAGINEHQPELIFLDVELDENQTGFDLLERITPRFFEVIFITAYDKFAIRAFQYSALHYMQKPIDEILFIQAINRAIETKKTKDFTKRFDVLLDNVRTDNLSSRKIMVPNLKGDEWLCLNVNQIVRIDSQGGQMIKITYEDKNKFLYTGLKKTIGEAEKMLEGNDFVRVHESHIVNIRYVESFKRSQKRLMMSDNEEVEVSRRSINLLVDRIKKF